MRLKLEVFRAPSGVVTVTTDRGDGGGVRLCGVKLLASGSRKVAEFYLDREAVRSIVEEFAEVVRSHDDACNCEECR